MDREKVIKGLEETEIMLKEAVDRGGEMAVMGAFKCYNHVSDAITLLIEHDDMGKELTDAMELIHKKNDRIKELMKEQEAVQVIQCEVMHMLVWCCGACGATITDGDKFCRHCGLKVKWE